MCHYHHLTLSERENLLFFRAQSYSISRIAAALGRDKSTISRELRRNTVNGKYLPITAQQQYARRRKVCKPHKRLENAKLFALVKNLFLVHHWSPEEIAGRLQLEHQKALLSYATIYRAIYAGMFDETSSSHGSRGAVRRLRHHGKSRHTRQYQERRGSIPISHDISERPAGAANRSRRGHWECDTIAGKTGKACLVTLVDRKSRYLVGGKAAKKTAQAVNTVLLQVLQGQPVKSLTPDRGKEFAHHAAVTEALNGVPFYFPPPHQPWQRGSNENTNGLVREYFPKGTDITLVPEAYVQAVFAELNRRPRKCLGYKTPYEVHYSKKLHLA